jgi:hypothetical protein
VATVPWSSTPPTDVAGLIALLESASGIPWESLGIPQAQ